MNIFKMPPLLVKPTRDNEGVKLKRLSYVYLYRMHRFNKAKDKLENYKANYDIYRYEANYDIHRQKKKEGKCLETMEKLAPKLNDEAMLHSFEFKQSPPEEEFREVATRWERAVYDFNDILKRYAAALVGFAAVDFPLPIAVNHLAPGLLKDGVFLGGPVGIGIFALSLIAGGIAAVKADQARKMLEIGVPVAEGLVSEVKKLAA